MPVSKHPIDSVNLADPRLGLLEQINELLARSGPRARPRRHRRSRPSERNVGLTVNEYETLLMQTRPRRGAEGPAALRGDQGAAHARRPARRSPARRSNYAKYDVVRVLNSLMEALRLDQSSLERLVAKVMSVPARGSCARAGSASSPARDGDHAAARVVRGTYSEPDPGAVAAGRRARAPRRDRGRRPQLTLRNPPPSSERRLAVGAFRG